MAATDLITKVGVQGVSSAEKELDRYQNSAKSIGPTFTQVAVVATAAFTTIAVVSKKAFDEVTVFNAGLANIATLIPGNIKRINELGGSIQDLSIQMGLTTEDLTEGMFQIVSAFGDSAEAARQLEIVAGAAAAGGATTSESLSLLSAVTKGYGDTSAEALEKAADLAFMTNKLGQTTFPELASSMGRVVPLASTLNASQEELFATFATLTGVTGRASEVSTQMAGVFQGLLKPTADMTTAMNKLGIEDVATTIAQDGLVQTLRNAIGTTDGSNASVAKLFGSVEALNAVLALTGSQADVFDSKFASMTNSAGAAEQAFADMTEGVNKTGFEAERLDAMVTVLWQTIGQKLDPVFSAFIVAAQIGVESLTASVEFLALTWNVFFESTQETDPFMLSNTRMVELNEQLVRNIEMFGEGSVQVLATERQITAQREKHQEIISANVTGLQKELGIKKELGNEEKEQTENKKTAIIEITEAELAAREKLGTLLEKGGPVVGGDTGELTEVDKLKLENEEKLIAMEAFNLQVAELMLAGGFAQQEIEEQFRLMSEERSQFIFENDVALMEAKASLEFKTNQQRLKNTASFMGSMASIASIGGRKLFKVTQAFGAGQAVVNAWTGASEALKLPFPANIAAFATVLKTGFEAVSNIRSASPGSGSSGGGAISTAGVGGISRPVPSPVGAIPTRPEQQATGGFIQDVKIVIHTLTGEVPQEDIDKIREGLELGGRESNKKLSMDAIEVF